jgi:hypothetical protein
VVRLGLCPISCVELAACNWRPFGKGGLLRRLLLLTSLALGAMLALAPAALAQATATAAASAQYAQYATATASPTATATALAATGGPTSISGLIALLAAVLLLGGGVLSFTILRRSS